MAGAQIVSALLFCASPLQLHRLIEVFLRRSVLRVETENCIEFRGRVRKASSFGQCHAEVQVSIREFWTEPNNFLELLDGLACPILRGKAEPEIIARLHELR